MKKIVIIFIALAALGAFAVYQQQITNKLLQLLGMEEEKKVIKGIASLNEVNKNVTVKRAADTVWNSAEPNEQLAIMDSVSTGFDSAATVKFDLGYLMNIGERSLVVIEDPKQEAANLIEVSFDQGTLEARSINTSPDSSSSTTTNANGTSASGAPTITTTSSAPGAPKTMLRIKSNNTVTEVKGETDFSMSVDKATKTAEIWIKIGEAKVRDNKGTEIIIKQNERKKISTDVIVKEPEPKPEEILAPPPEPTPEKVVPKPKPKPKKPERRLSRNEIIKAVARQKKKIDTCYERNRKAGSGKSLAVRMTIKNAGNVSGADIVRSNLEDPTVERCVIFWVKAIRFPKFDGAPIQETVNFAFQ